MGPTTPNVEGAGVHLANGHEYVPQLVELALPLWELKRRLVEAHE